jgi:LysR family hydrogen peroxide-inducible transcriptional activator
MIRISMRQLRYFDALARDCHFGRAAAACAISQPALSMQIKDLETSFGTALIERGGRGVRLTRVGEDVATRVRDILRAVDDLGDFARSAGARLTGRLRIGMIPTIAPYLLPALMTHLAESHPDLDVQIREALTSRLIDELADGRIDTAILALPVHQPNVTEVALFDEAFLLVRPESDAGTPVPSPESLETMKLLLLEEGHCFRDQALSFCNRQTPRAREMLDASSLTTLVQMVDARMGVTLIPEMAVAVETRSAAVSVTRFDTPEPKRTVGMIWRTSSPLAGPLADLAREVGRSAADLKAGKPAVPA